MRMNEKEILVHKPRHSHRGLASLETEAGDQGSDQGSCAAFGYVRGMTQRALAVELRLRNGTSETLPYNSLCSCRHDPSTGLLLKFTNGDVLTLVLILGSNLDAELPDRDINLTNRGLQRHKVTFIREMDEDEVVNAGEGEPTIDHILIKEFESTKDAREWLKVQAPVFVRQAV